MGTMLVFAGTMVLFLLFIFDPKGTIPLFGAEVYTAAALFYSALLAMMLGVTLRLVGLAAAIKANSEPGVPLDNSCPHDNA